MSLTVSTQDTEKKSAYSIHSELARLHGQYDKFDELMKEYSHKVCSFDITGAIGVICEFRDDMDNRNLRHFKPIIDHLNERVAEVALGIARSGGKAK